MIVLIASALAHAGIGRHALVTRHNVTLTKPDPQTPLSVGNGEFAFTADITGLQTFPGDYLASLGTQSQWGWHSVPNSKGYTPADALNEYTVAGRSVPYADGQVPSGGYSPAAEWLRANPHRLHLGQIGLRIVKSDGSPAKIGDLTETTQTLDLWAGALSSRFELEGQPATIRTICHPTRDLLAIRIESPLVESRRLSVCIAFPYAGTEWGQAADWSLADRHTTISRITDHQADWTRILDADRYFVRAVWSPSSEMRMLSQHEYEIGRQGGDATVVPRLPSNSELPERNIGLGWHGQTCFARVFQSGGDDPKNTGKRICPCHPTHQIGMVGALDLIVALSPKEIAEPLPGFDEVRAAATEHWRRFWMSGGAIDFSACTDPRAAELERRVVLSQYLTAIQCASSRPPQETGLTCNSWFGKSHLEMHWWHAVHFALWNRIDLLERSLPWYESILPLAQGTAKLQGYKGARWPKMVGPDGCESPSSVGVFLIWQQPHPIYYAELCYRARPNRETLDRYRWIVFKTAEFMASYVVWDDANHRYVLGPAMIPAQESYGPHRAGNLNPTFELAYWRWGLETAQSWRQRLGLERDAKWDDVIEHLSRPTIRNGVYTGIETPPYTICRDHPTMVAALGFVPAGPLIDRDVMQRTYDDILANWDWSSTWGWDYPMLAMTAARLGEPAKAVDALFLESPKNRFLANGHNYQSPRLPLYLPGNGGLLTAVAMMAAGWDGCPEGPAPGFPKDGTWNVRFEGLCRMP